MIVTTETVDIETPGSTMRTFVAAPKSEGTYPGILLYSDIFQLTGPTIRAAVRLAGYGYVVAAPEIYHRIEPPGTAIPFDDAGRTRGMEDAAKTSVAEFDADARATFDWLANDRRVVPGKLGAAGFCIGGHLALRPGSSRIAGRRPASTRPESTAASSAAMPTPGRSPAWATSGASL